MIFKEISYLRIFLKAAEKIKLQLKMTGIVNTLREDISRFILISCRFVLRMRNISKDIEEIKTHT
jgi:hypothetical protein